jgi:heme oxygenase
MLCDDYAVAEYVLALQRLYGFYEPLSTRTRYGAHVPEAGSRLTQRLGALAKDLSELGVSPHALDTIPRCETLPALRTPDRELGCAYVIEGSTLGGRFISKHLTRIFADRPRPIPMLFLAGDGKRAGTDWLRFCSRLNSDAIDLAEVCSGTCATFDAMIAWLSEP